HHVGVRRLFPEPPGPFDGLGDRGGRRLPYHCLPARLPGAGMAGDEADVMAGLARRYPDWGWPASGGDPAVYTIVQAGCAASALRRNLRASADSTVDRDHARLDCVGGAAAPLVLADRGARNRGRLPGAVCE